MPRVYLLAWEQQLSQRIAGQGRQGLGRAIAHLFSRSGDIWLWLPLTLLLTAGAISPGSRLLWSVAAAAALTALLKYLFRRRRPRPGIINLAGDQYAFPSGHAARAAALAITLAFTWPAFTPLFLIWAAATAYARIMRAAHLLLDVAAGLLVGAGVGLVLNIWIFAA